MLSNMYRKVINDYRSIYHQGMERIVISIITSCITGLAILPGLRGIGLPLAIAIPVTLVVIIIGTLLLVNRLPSELSGFSKRKPVLSFLWLLLAIISLVQIFRLSVFMLDPAKPEYSLFPGNQWLVEHCCLTAYSEGADLALAGQMNIYDLSHYLEKGAEPVQGLIPFRKIENFKVDLYHYPPPFLLLPFMTKAVAGGDFLNLRMIWYALSILTLMTAIGFIIYNLKEEDRIRMIGMAPLIWCSLPVLTGLQMSNVQIIVVSISIISMALFSINKPAGGMLLAMSTVAKIFPGILIVYMAAQRKLSEVLWVAGFAVMLALIAFTIVGAEPFIAFIQYELPRLSSGEAFSRPFSRDFALARNMSPFGIPLKLGWLGVAGMSLEVGRIVSMIYLLVIISLAIWAGRRKPRAGSEAVSVWVSLISLGSLVSPFAPANYVLVSVVLLICLNREFFPLRRAVVYWLLICLPFFISQQAPFIVQALCFLPAQLIAIGVPGFILYRAGLASSHKIKLSKTWLKTEPNS
jgi:hypothetical protein